MKKITISLLAAVVIFSATGLVAGSRFKELCAELVQSAAGASVITGVDGWLFLKDELRHIAAGQFWGAAAGEASQTKNKKYADPLPAIVKYNELLAEKNIVLYLMPVPPKALVYPDRVAEGVDGVDADSALEAQQLYQEFYTILEKEGVRTIDLLPTLLQNRDKANLYCKTDTHYSGQGLAYFARAAAEQIRREEWYKGLKKVEFELSPQKVTIRGDLLQMSGAEGGGEELELVVVTDKKSGQQIESDSRSPVVLLGDSHTLVFSAGGDLHAKGAGLFDHLSADLGFAVDLLGVRGSGVTPARINFYQRSKKDGGYLDGKKVVIWCFTARDFSGSGGWKDIPVAPKSKS